MKSAALALFLISTTPLSIDAQRLTLPELARLHAPEPLIQSRVGEFIAVALEQSLPEADLVLHGTVQKATTYLSSDQMDMFTDYLIIPKRVIRQRLSIPTLTRGIQSAAPVVVKQWGGTMTIEGVEVSQVDHDTPNLTTQQEVILLLSYNKTDKKYRIAPSGAFIVEQSKIVPLIQAPRLQKYHGLTVSQFEIEVQRLSR